MSSRHRRLRKNPVKVMMLSQPIAAPAAAVYRLLIDLPARMKWIDGIQRIEFRDEQPNHIGKVHRCVRDGIDAELVTSDVKVGAEAMELCETDTKKIAACRYRVVRAGNDTTDMQVEFYVRDSVLMRLVFKALVARKLKASFTRSLHNLARLAEATAT